MHRCDNVTYREKRCFASPTDESPPRQLQTAGAEQRPTSGHSGCVPMWAHHQIWAGWCGLFVLLQSFAGLW